MSCDAREKWQERVVYDPWLGSVRGTAVRHHPLQDAILLRCSDLVRWSAMRLDTRSAQRYRKGRRGIGSIDHARGG
jgi:hypothetical protein